MFDRHATRSPEEQLDRWLDALNDPTVPAPPPPDGIAAVAGIARRYQQVLGATPAHAVAHTTIPERNGHMNAALPLPTSPNGASRKATPPVRRHRSRSRTASWLGWLSTSLSTAVVIGLILAMGGAMIYQQNGLPGGSDDPASAPGFAASPEATPANNTALSCASPGYRAVVEGDVNPDTLAMIGETEAPLTLNDGEFHIPTPSGETANLSAEWTSIGGPMWTNLDDSTVRNIDTGEEWVYPLQVGGARAIYRDPYLVMPATGNATDWKILDTTTGAERLISNIRGEPFPTEMQLSVISFDPIRPTTQSEPTVWLFKPDILEALDPTSVTPVERNTLFLPGKLDDARFIDETVDAQWFGETAWSAATNQLAFATGTGVARTIVVLNPSTGESIAIHNDAFTGETLPLLFSADGATLIVEQPTAIFAVSLSGEPAVKAVYQSSEPFTTLAHNAASGHVLVERADGSVALVDTITGNTTDLPDVTVPSPRFETTGPRRTSYETTIYELFDYKASTVQFINMETGTVSTVHHVLNSVSTEVSLTYQTEFTLNVRYPHETWSDGQAWLDSEGTMHVEPFDQNSASWTVPTPAEFALKTNEVARILVNPSESCVVLQLSTAATLTFDQDGASSVELSKRIATWIAPLEPGAEWTKLDTHITGWFRTAEQPETKTLPAQEIPATISAPQASPAANSPVLSCASPGYRAVVRGDVDTSDLALIGTTAEPIILNNGDVTITATNGTEITFAEGEGFYRQGNVVLTGGDKGEPTTVTSLVTGESWTFPPVDQSPNQFSTGTVQIPPWLIGPTDDSQTEWRIINTTTGEERLTSDLFGGPLDHISQPAVPGPWAYNASPSAIIHFVPEVASDRDYVAPVVVLPTANPDDAHALDDIHASAGWTGAITSDGSRIAYVTEDAFRVLDGFTGEQLAEYPLPKSGGFYETIGLTADDSKLILQFNQQLWTVDLASGDIVSVFDPGAQIHSLEFDNATGNIIASAGDRGQPPLFWIDPLTAEVKPLAAPLQMRPPQPQFGWALFQTRDPGQIGVGYSLLDMATGEIATTTQVASGDDNGTNVIIIGGGDDPAGIYAVRAEPDSMLVLDGPGGQSFELPIPDGARQQTSSVAIGFSPNSACLYYTEVTLPGEEEGGTSWVAPLAPDAEWTQLPFELAGFWAPIEPAPAPEATPAASPVATPRT